MLTFLQKHFNTILQYKNPDYLFEFLGYEKDDKKQVIDIDKEEVASYKTLNEKREEKGQNPLDFTKIKNPADLPMNPQVIQAWQGVQRQDEEEIQEDEVRFAGGVPDEDMQGFEAGEDEQTEGNLRKEKGGWHSIGKSINAVKIVV